MSDNDVINALKRLQRAGDANSATNAKLIDAAQVLGREINRSLSPIISRIAEHPEQLHIPYDVAVRHESIPRTVMGGTAERVGVVLIDLGSMDRQTALAIGDAVASDLVQHIAEWAEAHNQAAVSATTRMLREAK